MHCRVATSYAMSHSDSCLELAATAKAFCWSGDGVSLGCCGNVARSMEMVVASVVAESLYTVWICEERCFASDTLIDTTDAVWKFYLSLGHRAESLPGCCHLLAGVSLCEVHACFGPREACASSDHCAPGLARDCFRAMSVLASSPAKVELKRPFRLSLCVHGS